MQFQRLSIILTALVLVTACETRKTQVVEPEQPILVETDVPVEPPVSTGMEEVEEPPLPPTKTSPDCLNGEVSPIGEAIAEEYEAASYEQVMTWFCDGAAFEDILTALETEAQTDTPAVEMLEMIADGFTWEEIWQLTGLTD